MRGRPDPRRSGVEILPSHSMEFRGHGACPEWCLVKSGHNDLLVPPNQVIKPRRGWAGKPRAQALGNGGKGDQP